MELKRALRSALARPGLTALVVSALALGIGLNTSIFSVVYAVLLRSLPYQEPERLVRVWEARPRMGADAAAMAAFSMDHFRAWRDANDVFSAMAVHQDGSFNLTGGAEPVRIEGQSVSPSLFPMLGVEPLVGRVFSPDEAVPGRERVAVLSHGVWRRLFGSDEGIAGRTIHLDGNPYTVVGVMPSEFRFPNPETEIWVPAVDAPPPPLRPGEMRIELAPVIAKLAPGVSLEEAEAAGQAFLENYRGGSAHARELDQGVTIHLTSIREQLVRPVRPALLVLFGAVTFVLLIICANLANLFLARSESRRVELSVRSALGAGRGTLLREALAESLLYGVAGGLLGVLVAYWSLRLLVAVAPTDTPLLRDARLDAAVLAFNVGVTMLTALLVGIVPAIRASRTDVVSGLRGLTRARTSRSASRGVLAVSEIALALVLFAACGLMLRSFYSLATVDPGYEPRDVLTFRLSLPPSKYPDGVSRKRFFDELDSRLASLPGAMATGLVSTLPLDQSRMITMFRIDGMPEPEDRMQMPRASVRIVSADFFRAMGIRLLSGRSFEPSDRPDTAPVVVVNESLVKRYLGDEPPLGRGLGRTGTIAGVVADFRQLGLDADPEPEIYLSYQQSAGPLAEALSSLAVAVRYDPRTSGFPDAVKAVVREIDPELPLADVRTMEARLAESVARPRLYAVLLSLFSAVALVVAASGVYSVVSYQAQQRTRENGLRMALGATSSDIVRRVLGDGVRILLFGVPLGLAGAVASTRALRSVLFATEPFDPMTLIAVTLLLAGAVLFASALPARRASRLEPMKALRYE
jgi:putative ABC transport system permease protein